MNFTFRLLNLLTPMLFVQVDVVSPLHVLHIGINSVVAPPQLRL